MYIGLNARYICTIVQFELDLDTNESNASLSSNPNLQLFSIFSNPRKGATNLSSKADNSSPCKGKTLTRKPGIRTKIKNSPPNNSKITNHFKPASRISETSNESEVEARGERVGSVLWIRLTGRRDQAQMGENV